MSTQLAMYAASMLISLQEPRLNPTEETLAYYFPGRTCIHANELYVVAPATKQFRGTDQIQYDDKTNTWKVCK